MPLSLQYAGFTHSGPFRTNQDALLLPDRLVQKTALRQGVFRMDQPWVVAVADGMGGFGQPARASREVLRALHRRHRPGLSAEKLVQAVHEDLCSAAGSAPALYQSGAVLAVVQHDGAGNLLLWNIGDVRLYGISQLQVTQLSRDQLLRQSLVDSGELAADAPPLACDDWLDGALTADPCEPTPAVSPRQLRASAGLCLLLCSDGIYPHFDAEEWRPLASMTADAGMRWLAGECHRRPCHDNQTALLLKLVSV